MEGLFYTLILSLIAASLAERFEFDEDIISVMSKSKLMRKVFRDKFSNNKPFTVTDFRWKNCGSSADAVRVNSITLSPDPLKLPGLVTAGFNVTFKAPIVAPLKVDLKIEKKVAVWVEIPCIENVGSCTYNDVCSLIPLPPGGPCPPPFSLYNIPCTCPFKPGTYSLPEYQVQVAISIPSFLKDGNFYAKAVLSTKGKEVGCLDGYVTITDS